MEVRTKKIGQGKLVCQSYGNGRAGSQNQVKPEVKVYRSDKSYD